MRVGLAQINLTVGDIAGNAERILDRVREGEHQGCDLITTPELALTGYPPEDLILKPAFIKDNLTALRDLAPLIKKSVLVLGFINESKGKRYNAAAWIEKGRIKKIYHKHCLPNYGVFDEQRYFSKGESFVVEKVKGLNVAVTICEDLWAGPAPIKYLKTKKSHLVVNLSASPFTSHKVSVRAQAIKQSAAFLKAPVLYTNLVGGQDELVFDGGSFGLSPRGQTRLQFAQFQENLFLVDVQGQKSNLKLKSPTPSTKPLSEEKEMYEALVMGTRDYANKNKFQKVAVSLSGGIDSSLVAAIAVDALGPERVVGITMPSRYNLKETKNDAKKLSKNLGISFLEISIEEIFKTYLHTLTPHFDKFPMDATEENIQARIRGNLLMALSNKFGWLVLTTGNKSETSVGYCTLYGDMAGGFSVLKDVLKTKVYKLSKYANVKAKFDRIPKSVLMRPPSAELRKDQRDEDSLGSYGKLDEVIQSYVEENQTLKEIIKKTKLSESYVNRILGMIDGNEYKRRQAPPGIKITPRAFGRDHRMPMTNRYKSR